MRNKTFTLRIDLESNKGIKEGLPKILDLLKKYDIKASFYLVMGRESNLIELLRYRKKIESSGERKIKLWSLREKLRLIFFPINFVKLNTNILKRILDEGHELGLHGWKHRAWTRGLDKIDIENHLDKSIKKYKKIFKKNPISWSSPAFNTNDNVLRSLENKGIKFISDFPGNKEKNYGKLKNIPMTITGKNKMPIIEYLVSKNKSDSEIVEDIKKEVEKKKLVSFYLHGMYEGRFKIHLLEEVLKYLKTKDIKNKKVVDF